MQHRRNEPILQHHLPIAPAFDDVRQRDRGVGIGQRRHRQQAGAQARDLEHRGVCAGRGNIPRVQFGDLMTDDIGGPFPIDIGLPGSPQRNRQVHDLVAKVGIDIDRRRQRIVVRQPERGAVGEYAGEVPHTELADGKQVALDLDIRESPAVAREGAATRFDVALEIAILLLEMLWLQKQPLRPDDFVMDRHSRTSTPEPCRPCGYGRRPISLLSRLMRESIYNRCRIRARLRPSAVRRGIRLSSRAGSTRPSAAPRPRP